MAIASAASTSSLVSQAIKNRYYVELFLRVAEKNLVHQQLGQLNQQVPSGENATVGTGPVYWTRWLNLPIITAGQGEGIPTTAVALSATNVSAVAAQYDNAVSVSDLLVKQSFGDVMKAAMQRLAYNAGLSIDTIVRNVAVLGGVSQIATGAANYTSVPATGVFSVSELRKAIRTLQRNDAFKVGGGINSNEPDANGYWVAVLHPDSAYDIMGDTATGAWIDANKYAGSEAIFQGEIGKLYGARFLQTSNAYSLNSGVVASGNVYATLVTGSDYFGVTTLQNLQTFIKDFGSAGAGDPTNKISTAGWKTTFAAAVLNSSFAVTVWNSATA